MTINELAAEIMDDQKDLLEVAFENLKASILKYETLRELAKDGEMTTRALHDYYRKEREFNHHLGLWIRENNDLPDLAEEAVMFQRSHGFHARGTAKIIHSYDTKIIKAYNESRSK